MLRITNISGGQLVSTLSDGSTLRLNHKQSVIIREELCTDYLRNIENKRLVRITDTAAAKAVTNKKEV